MAEIKRIAVVGAGAMGGGIAHLAAQSGFEVVLRDVTDQAVSRAIANMERLNARAVAKGRLTEGAAKEMMARLKPTTEMNDLAGADLVIEAVFEDLEIKKQVFSELDRLCKPETILASNTSSMSITVIAQQTRRPAQVCGMHFFNPPQLMKLVECVRGYETADATIATAMEVSRRLGREPVEVKRDTPGFIVNRIMLPMMMEAIRVLEEGIASKEDIDKAVVLGLNHPMGPLTLADFTGLDVDLNVVDYFYSEFRDPKWAAPQTLRQLVRAGRLGKKAGKGFYDDWDKRA